MVIRATWLSRHWSTWHLQGGGLGSPYDGACVDASPILYAGMDKLSLAVESGVPFLVVLDG